MNVILRQVLLWCHNDISSYCFMACTWEHDFFLVWISLYFGSNFVEVVPKGSSHNESALVQIIAWRRTGDETLSDPLISYFTDIYASLSLDALTLAWQRFNAKPWECLPFIRDLRRFAIHVIFDDWWGWCQISTNMWWCMNHIWPESLGILFDIQWHTNVPCETTGQSHVHPEGVCVIDGMQTIPATTPMTGIAVQDVL